MIFKEPVQYSGCIIESGITITSNKSKILENIEEKRAIA